MKEIIRPEAAPLRTLPSAELKCVWEKQRSECREWYPQCHAVLRKKKLLKVRLICHWTFKKEKQTGVNIM